MIFQITEDDVDHSSTLDREDIGKWAFILNGCIQITECKSRDEVIEKVTYCMR